MENLFSIEQKIFTHKTFIAHRVKRLRKMSDKELVYKIPNGVFHFVIKKKYKRDCQILQGQIFEMSSMSQNPRVDIILLNSFRKGSRKLNTVFLVLSDMMLLISS